MKMLAVRPVTFQHWLLPEGAYLVLFLSILGSRARGALGICTFQTCPGFWNATFSQSPEAWLLGWGQFSKHIGHPPCPPGGGGRNWPLEPTARSIGGGLWGVGHVIEPVRVRLACIISKRVVCSRVFLLDDLSNPFGRNAWTNWFAPQTHVPTRSAV